MSCAKRVALAALTLLLMALLVRGLDGVIGLIVPYEHEANIRKGDVIGRSMHLREHRPGIDTVMASPIAADGHKSYRLRTDQDAYIIGPKDIGTTQRPVDIVFFGGSSTECLWVEEDKRFPYLVSQLLNTPAGTPIRTANAGRHGNNAMHSLLNLIGKSIDDRPRFAVLMHAINDLSMLSKTGSYWAGPEGRKVMVERRATTTPRPVDTLRGIDRIARGLKDLLLPNSWARLKLVILQETNPESVDEWSDYRAERVDPERVRQTIDRSFAAALRSFVSVARAWGIEPILMTQFNRVSYDYPLGAEYKPHEQPFSWDDFVDLYRYTNATVRRIAREENVFLIDLAEAVPPSPDLMVDTVHLNSAGSQITANAIADALLRAWPERFTDAQ